MKPDKIIFNDANVYFRTLSKDRVFTVYPVLFKEVFGYFDDYHIPQIVDIVLYNSDIIGFLSGCLWNKDTWYTQFAGLKEKYRGLGMAKELWEAHIKRIQSLFDVKYITVRTENTNKAVTIFLAKAGFIQVGISGGNGKMYVQWTRRI